VGKRRRIVWTVDAETDPFLRGRVPQPFIWGAYCGENEQGQEEYYEFATVAQLVEFFRYKSVVVYAHNGGKFDYHYLRDELNSDEPIMVISGRLAKFKIGECEFRDSLNIFPNTRLEDFGGKIKIDYSKFEADKRSDPNILAEIKRYLKQDCVLLWDTVARYRREYGTALTQAGASMRYWEKMAKTDAPRQTKAQHDRYKPHYYGGRVQCFESGNLSTTFSVADINSAYPEGMLWKHPICPEAQILSTLPPMDKIAQCLITLDATSRGALPWRDPETSELFFPDDEHGNRKRLRTYKITGWEFLAGLELNAIEVNRIRQVHYFPQTISFRDYIEHFYNLREEARLRKDIAGRTFGKYFMCGLYGKFGANPENYAEYVIATDESRAEWHAKGYRDYKPWGDRFLLERKPLEDELNDLNGKWRFYNVATAASVTGYVRANLFRALSASAGAIYCDTDSIAARDVGKLAFGTKLGQWKHEGTFDRYSIAGKKLYAFHHAGAAEEYDPDEKDNPTWKVASKGVNFGKLADGPSRISAIAAGGEINHEPEVPTYSIIRSAPVFIGRTIRHTAKDIRIAPEALPA